MTNLVRNMARKLVAALTVLAALCTVSVVAETTPVSAYTTVFYNGAGSQPRIGLIGDSSLSGVRWYGTFEPLKRLNFTFDAESCRRTIELSCRGREGYAPENGITVLRRLEGRIGKVLVMVTGYNDPGYRFGDAVDAIMAEAIRQRIPYVMWLTMRTADVSYVSPTYQSTSYTFRDNNRILLQKAQRYGGRLQIADWATYSANQPSWVASDGVHMTVAGGNAITDFIVDQSLLVLSGRTVTPPPTTETTQWVTVRRGDRGPRVAMVQNALIRKGYPLVGGADGVFGAYTEAALQRFQRDVGLLATGVADRRTAIKLGVYRPTIGTPTCKVAIPLWLGDRIADATCLNRHLYSRGFDVAVQPLFDSRTRAAVNFINYARGWTQDGIADRRVLTAIGAWRTPTGERPFCASSRTLSRGQGGSAVVCLRRHLTARGYLVQDDKKYGSRVAAAVHHFKRHHSISPVDGVAGKAVLSELGIWNPPCTVSIPLRPGDDIGDVVCLEQHLAGRGHKADLRPEYGGVTAAGVRAVERAVGLPVNGVADEALLRAIGAWAEPSGVRPVCTVSRTLRGGDQGAAVNCLEARLRGLGYHVNIGELYGADTAAAVRHYRSRRGIAPFTGVAVPQVLQSLGIWSAPASVAATPPSTPPTTEPATTAPPTTTTTTVLPPSTSLPATSAPTTTTTSTSTSAAPSTTELARSSSISSTPDSSVAKLATPSTAAG